MRKRWVLLLCAVILSGMLSAASAQTVSCPDAHLTFTAPDSWTVIAPADPEDPDLRLLLRGDDLSLSVYVAESGGLPPDSFLVFTGDETESGSVTVSGMDMFYVAGQSSEGDYRIYTWPDRSNQVQLYFLITGRLKPARKAIDEILSSLVFE